MATRGLRRWHSDSLFRPWWPVDFLLPAQDCRSRPGVLQPVLVSLCRPADLPPKLFARSGGRPRKLLEVLRPAHQQFHRQLHRGPVDAVCHRIGRSALENFSSLAAGVSNGLRRSALSFGIVPFRPAPCGNHLPPLDRWLRRAPDCLSFLLPAWTAHGRGIEGGVCGASSLRPVCGLEQPCGPPETPARKLRAHWFPHPDLLSRLRRSRSHLCERAAPAFYPEGTGDRSTDPVFHSSAGGPARPRPGHCRTVRPHDRRG